jgi:citrate synthase
MERVARGLAGVVIDDTRISDIDGQAGQLRYRGYPIEELVQLPFATVLALLLAGELPDARGTADMAERLRAGMQLPADLARTVLAIAGAAAHPMLALQSATPLLAGSAAQDDGWPGFTLAARLPAALALVLRGEAALGDVGGGADGPLGALPYGAHVLRLLTGKVPAAEAARAFEQTQVLQMDHGFNAGTFTARVVASTLAPVQSAVSAAIGALYGPLHGGADQAAIEMARAIATPSAVGDAMATMRRRGDKVMGMGHREYRVMDPRAAIIEGLAQALARPGAGAEEFAVLQAVARHVESESRGLHPNIEFYKGVVFLALGIPPTAFTTCFAIARVWGYLAHFAECREHNRILRPAAEYVGAPLRHVPGLPAAGQDR